MAIGLVVDETHLSNTQIEYGPFVCEGDMINYAIELSISGMTQWRALPCRLKTILALPL